MTLAVTDESEVIVELWEKMKEYINVNKRDDAAITFIETFLESGISFDKNEVGESDTHLDNAITILDDELEEDIEDEE